MATLTNPLPALSSVQLDAVVCLAAGNSITAAAQQADVHRATIHNWLKLPDFSTAVAQAQCTYAERLQDKLKEIAGLAVDTIRHTLTAPEISPAVRLRAALAVLDRSLFPKPAGTIHEQANPTTPVDSGHAQPTSAGIPRNATCPCGSGIKYKRCCGTNAPPQLSRAA